MCAVPSADPVEDAGCARECGAVIVVFGTVNVDMVTVVPRFPVPGETVKGRDYQVFPGGKGANQALAAARAGAKVALVAAVQVTPLSMLTCSAVV